jgi:NAD-dependent deacetylase
MKKKKIVVLTGAGISAESGIQTFHDSVGLWEGYDVYQVASPRGWAKNPSLVLDFYNQRRKQILAAKPNEAHIGLAALEKYFEVIIITQNIDDLHERAGSTQVLHLHGEIRKMRSVLNPNNVFPIEGDMHLGDTAADGGQLRPHIVWFEEPVPLIEKAIEIVCQADLFVLIGSSLAVYPAAGLINCAPLPIPKFIIDKKIPVTESLPNVIKIETGAVAGVELLKQRLTEYL